MKTKIIKVGNSRGIRLPKAILEAGGLEDEVELVLQKNGILIRSARSPREGWEEQARRLHQAGEDKMLDPDVSLSSWDDKEWEW
jgi:antitoxin MazE